MVQLCTVDLPDQLSGQDQELPMPPGDDHDTHYLCHGNNAEVEEKPPQVQKDGEVLQLQQETRVLPLTNQIQAMLLALCTPTVITLRVGQHHHIVHVPVQPTVKLILAALYDTQGI